MQGVKRTAENLPKDLELSTNKRHGEQEKSTIVRWNIKNTKRDLSGKKAGCRIVEMTQKN